MIYNCHYCGLPASNFATGLAMPMCKCVITRPSEEKPKREWVGLTEDEIWDAYEKGMYEEMWFARAVEAKLKEKNT